MKYVEMFFDEEIGILTLEEPDGTYHKFDHTQLREIREVLHQYDEANFHARDHENEIAFKEFTQKMAIASPEVFEVASPYLN